MVSVSQKRQDSDRLEFQDEPVKLTRAQWVANCRLGAVHRFAGKRYLVCADARRGRRLIRPVLLIEDH